MATLTAQAGEFAFDFYELLRTLDRTPGEDSAPTLRARVETLLGRCRELVQRASQDEAVAALVRTLQAILAALEDLRLRLAREWSTTAFSSFRSAAAPHYEALAARLRALRVPAPTLRPENLKRSGYHVANGLFAAACIELLPWTGVRILAGLFFAFAAVMELGRRHSAAWNRFATGLFKAVIHPSEQHRINSATWYSVALFTLALLSGPIPSLCAVLALGLGDPCAAFVGRRWGRTRLWGGRSLEGSLGFVAAAFLIVFAGLALFHGTLPMSTRLLVAAVSGVAGAFTELVSGRVDDNLSIPLAVAAAAQVTLLVVGI